MVLIETKSANESLDHSGAAWLHLRAIGMRLLDKAYVMCACMELTHAKMCSPVLPK